MGARFRWFLPAALGLLGSCGGVKREAKIATAIQVLMANSITSFAARSDDSLTISFNCGVTDADGTMTYELPNQDELRDPLQLIEFIRNNQDGIQIPVTFNNCVVKACGSTLTLDGGGTTDTAALTLDVSPEALVDSGGDLSSIPARFALSLNKIKATGLLTGNVTFAYIIEANYTTESLDSIQIYDTTTPAPLEDDGKTYDAEDIADLADGC